MSDLKDFVIENGVLKQYKGSGGSVEIPAGVTAIGEGVFRYSYTLTEVILPDTVTEIAGNAFESCMELVRIWLPDSVKKPGRYSYCKKLREVRLPTGLDRIDAYMFNRCSALRVIEIPESVTAIGEYAFSCCPLEKIILPEGLTEIGDSAFSQCSLLREIRLPESLVSIGNSAFSLCSALKHIRLPESLRKLGSGAFFASGLEEISLPEGLRSIDGRPDGLCGTFASCELARVSLPESLEEIGTAAFQTCRKLRSIRIPKGVKKIGAGAFQSCSALSELLLEGEEIELGSGAFRGCRELADAEGYVIVKGVLFDGPQKAARVQIPQGVTAVSGGAFEWKRWLTEVTIPEGVKSIGRRAFYGCQTLAELRLPESLEEIGQEAFGDCIALTGLRLPEKVKRLGNFAFQGCEKLERLSLPSGLESLGVNTLKNCKELKLLESPLRPSWKTAPSMAFILHMPGEKNPWYAYSAKAEEDNLGDYAREGAWTDYDKELVNNGPGYKYKLPARLLGALGRLLDGTELTAENRSLLEELLRKNAKKMVPAAEELGHPEILRELLELQLLDAKGLKALQKLMEGSSVPEIAALASLEIAAAAPAKQESKAESLPQSPLQAEYAQKLKAIKGEAVIRKMKLVGKAMPKVRLADGEEAPEELFRFLLASYGSQMGGRLHIDPEADKAARLLAYDSLCQAMDQVSDHLDGPDYPAVLPLLCRFGNALQIRDLLRAMGEWNVWQLHGQKGNRAVDVLMQALLLSDTREAVVWLERNDKLGDYAALRGITEAEVYEQYLFDFGFDESGKRVFDLGPTSVEVTLTRELTLALYDLGKKKAVRAIPKKDIDPAVQKKAADELADMRQNLKKAVKIKNSQLFQDYLDGTRVPAEAWKRSYLQNSFLHRVGQLLVWSQEGRCFLLTDEGLQNSAGEAFTLTDGEICVAHPMEMEPAEVKAWQRLFTHRAIKQPFQQIWEPVIDPAQLKEERYLGCGINPLFLKNQEKRGIRAEWYENEYVWNKHVEIRGFFVEARDAQRRDGEDRDYIELSSVVPEAWNRRANGVIAYLDRITVWERIRKDDCTVSLLLDSFTLAQITEFIRTAQEAKAMNVLALLLEYKNSRYADFDPMEEFTLEW